jgi:gliding motility-associated-like protein
MSRFYKIFFVFFIGTSLALAQAPTSTITVPSTSLCTGHTYTFNAITSSGSAVLVWAISPAFSVNLVSGTAVSNSTSTSTQAFINFGRSGVYSLSLTATDSNGSTTATALLNVSQNAIAAFNASLNTVGYPNQMVLTNYSSNQLSSQWLYSDAPSDNTPSTVKDYTASGNYTISLVAYGANACNDTSVYRFRIADSSGITVPNIFTPNNDSINDVFRPISFGIVSMNVWVYDRFGTLMTHWDRPKGFWDGRNTSGDPLSAGVYFYVLEAAGFDGRSYKLKGNVSLLR